MNRRFILVITFFALLVFMAVIYSSYYKDNTPIVVTAEAKLGEDTISLQGLVTEDGGKEITEYGFNWGTSSNVGDTYKVGEKIQVNNTYKTTILELEAGSTYYYQAYAINDKGIGYSNVEKITIPVLPNKPPTVSFITPSTDITVNKGELVKISAEADDDKSVELISIYINGEVKGKEKDNIISFDWDTTNAELGEYTIKVAASDGKKSSDKNLKIRVKEPVNQVATNSVANLKPTSNQPSRGSIPVAASNKYPLLSKVNGSFGQFPYRDIAGGRIEIDPQWLSKNIVTITLPGLNRRVEVHKDAADNFIMAFNYIKNGTAVINGQKVPLLSLIKTMDGTFVPRHINWNSSRGLSNHSWGTAIDINAANHFRYVNPATEPNNPNLILWEKAFKPAGFSWGNSYSDAMHYEILK